MLLHLAPFSQGLSSSGALAYLGHQWRRSVASAGGDLPMQGDLAAEQLICNVPGVDAARRERLIKLLDINLQWRMHQVSDGQRRRVQICMGLLKPFQVLLLDEARRPHCPPACISLQRARLHRHVFCASVLRNRFVGAYGQPCSPAVRP